MVVVPPGVTVLLAMRSKPQHKDNIALFLTIRSRVMPVSTPKPERVASTELSLTIRSPVMVASAPKPERVVSLALL